MTIEQHEEIYKLLFFFVLLSEIISSLDSFSLPAFFHLLTKLFPTLKLLFSYLPIYIIIKIRTELI